MPPTSLLRIAPLAIVAMLSAACSSNPPTASLAPVASDSNPSNRLLRPGDVVKVTVFGHNDVSGEFPVDENANLLLPIVGEISDAPTAADWIPETTFSIDASLSR